MVEYRPLPDSALDDFRSYLTYAFNPAGDRYDPEEAEELPPTMQVGEQRGLFDEDTLVSVCVHHFFTTRLRGDWHQMGGLSAVATPPEYRRQGHVRTLLSETLQEYRDRDVNFAALWAFSEPFYEQFGWAIAHRFVLHEGAPEALSFAREYPSGSFFQADKSDWESLDDVLRSHGERYELTVDRTEEWWHNRIFHTWIGEPYVYGWKDDDGSVEGYVVFTIDEDTDDSPRLQVWDMAFTTHEARLNLLRLLSNHEAQIESVRVPTPMDSLLIDLVDDPSKLDYSVKAGSMVRLVDVETALESLSYPEDLSATVTLAVTDQLADWNDSTFTVEFEDGGASVEETDREPDVSADVGTLSQLVVGYRPLDRLEREGDLVVHDAEVRTPVDTAFPERSVFMRENF